MGRIQEAPGQCKAKQFSQEGVWGCAMGDAHLQLKLPNIKGSLRGRLQVT